jgi:hypothetical protein
MSVKIKAGKSSVSPEALKKIWRASLKFYGSFTVNDMAEAAGLPKGQVEAVCRLMASRSIWDRLVEGKCFTVSYRRNSNIPEMPKLTRKCLCCEQEFVTPDWVKIRLCDLCKSKH